MTATSVPADAEMISIGGFNKHVGPLHRLPDGEDGTRRYAFVAIEKHMNASGTIHGGMLMAFADVSMSRTVQLAADAKSCSTISLSCDFLAPGSLGDLIESRIRVAQRTRTLMFVSAEIFAGDKLLLTASGIWKIEGTK